jgi:hypothetical protein
VHDWKIKEELGGIVMMQQAHKSKNVLCTIGNILHILDASTGMNLGMFAH